MGGKEREREELADILKDDAKKQYLLTTSTSITYPKRNLLENPAVSILLTSTSYPVTPSKATKKPISPLIASIKYTNILATRFHSLRCLPLVYAPLVNVPVAVIYSAVCLYMSILWTVGF